MVCFPEDRPGVRRSPTFADASPGLRFLCACTQTYQPHSHCLLSLLYHAATLAVKVVRNRLLVTPKPGARPSLFCTGSKMSVQSGSCPARWTTIKRSKLCSLSATQLQCESPIFTASSHVAILHPGTHSRERFCETAARLPSW